jgi:alkanesulfonate monooxygenase SsuD/methylene tetrahydromethanopterin reductase-like flavin-dependent oxidoreductase (luciferase family)
VVGEALSTIARMAENLGFKMLWIDPENTFF